MATAIATIFEGATNHSGDSARKLLIAFRGVLVVDGWRAYAGVTVAARQYCGAH